jgi:hypothetical protein
MKTSFLQSLTQSIKRACGKGSAVELPSNVPIAARSPEQQVAALIQRGENLRDECSKAGGTINLTDVRFWERESKTFIDRYQTADEQAIAERVSRVPINAASLQAPRDDYFVTIVHTLQHLNILSKRLNGSNQSTEDPNTA